MRKTTAAVAGALFLAAVLALTGCPNSATVQPEGGKTPSNTGETKTEKTEALTTSGTMEKPALQADGSFTLTTTDSNGGTYTFTQPAPPAASIRSASSSGTWDYTNKDEIKQFAGSYSGDITSSGANSLSLTVEKAADPSGKLQEVTEPQSFDFEVSDSGTFSATIPAVEIVVQVKPPAGTSPSIIKTVTKESSYSSSDSTLTCDFYSDDTFKMYAELTFRPNDESVNFSYKQEGIAFTGTYTGNPLEDGLLIANIQKMSKKYYKFDYLALYQAYKDGKTSVTISLTEEDLVAMQTTMPIKITGSQFQDEIYDKASYSQNNDGSTTFQVNVSGENASHFQLKYRTYTGEDSNGSETQQTGSFGTPLSVAAATDDTKVVITLFWSDDTTPDVSYDYISLSQTTQLKQGHNAQIDMKIRKISVPFIIEGTQDQYEDIRIYSDSHRALDVPASSAAIDFYILDQYDISDYTLYAKNSGGYSISDSVPVIIDKENPPTTPVTIRLYDTLTDGNKITITGYPSDTTFTEEEKKHFRFAKADSGLAFYIPVGDDTDGSFLGSGSIIELFQATYYPIDHLDRQANNNHTYQFTGLIQNMQDVVWFLENRMNLTVEGTDLFKQIQQQ
ncbi:MAG: hypothetical protein IJ441_10280 [Spirochaetaceae bacterium]|nr:hypothetical protein [Spirochaetaceae bacterium]